MNNTNIYILTVTILYAFVLLFMTLFLHFYQYIKALYKNKIGDKR